MRRAAAWARDDLWFALAAVFVVAAYVTLGWEQLRSGLEFDESYNLSVAMNLAEGHGYAAQGAVTGRASTPFDPLVSTGPVLLLPTALMWHLGSGFGPLVRVPALAFFALYVAGAWVCGRRLGGRWAGLAAAAAPLLVPAGVADLGTYSLVPGRVVGEFTACALLLWAALLLPSQRTWAVLVGGLCAGLAFETKTSFVAAIALLGLGWTLVELLARRWTLRRALAAAMGVMAPIAAWELFRRLSLGAEAFGENTAELLVFADAQSEPQDSSVVVPRLRDLAQVLTDARLAALVVAGALAVVGVALVVARARRRESDVVELAVIGLLGLAGVLLGLAWVTMSSQASARQGMPTLLLCLPLVLALATVAVGARSARSAGSARSGLLAPVVAVPVAVLASLTVVHTWGTTWNTELLRHQEAAARVIEESGTPSIMTRGWFMHVEYQLLTGLPSDRVPGIHPATVRISTPVEGTYGPGIRATASPDPCPGRELYRSWAAVVCGAD